jgi:hypothetical protein
MLPEPLEAPAGQLRHGRAIAGAAPDVEQPRPRISRLIRLALRQRRQIRLAAEPDKVINASDGTCFVHLA